jgi:phosphoglycerol transferase MdoB-like AlkP superfamily enzyme
MQNKQEKEDYGITIFSSNIPQGEKMRKIIFFIGFCLIILIQACYWLFANSVEPIIIGLPFGLFFVVLFIIIEFVALLALYYIEADETEK